MNETTDELTRDEKLEAIQNSLGMVDDCGPCNMVGVIGALVSFGEAQPDFDVSLLTEELPNDTEADEWMRRIRETAKSCDREVVECDTVDLVVEALELKLEELGEPYARDVSEAAAISTEG